MKASQFNILVDDPEKRETILFNTLYGGITVCDESESRLVKEILKRPGKGQDDTDRRLMLSLIEGKYIVHDELDELAIAKNRKLLGMKDTNRLDLVIMPNMTCNFACPYCFETHIPSSFMTDETETAIKNYLKSEVPNYKVLMLNWFGGEPLLSYKKIVSIGKLARELCDTHDIGFMTNITSNGYLLNAKRIEELISTGIYSYQITVDGPPEIHNRTRVLKNGGDSFWRIYENIVLLARVHGKVSVSLRVNFNHTNFYSIPELLQLFPEDIRHQLKIMYEPIFGDKCLSATDNIDGLEISSKMTEYYHLAQELGYDVVLGSIGTGRLVYCFAERENQFIINYNGDLFKCSACSYKKEERVGHLDPAGKVILNNKELDKWFSIDAFEEKCNTCKYLPLCMGGCRKARVHNAGTGSVCNLVPTNTSFALKSVAFGNFENILRSEYVNNQTIGVA